MNPLIRLLLALGLALVPAPGALAQQAGKLGPAGSDGEGKLGHAEEEQEKKPFPATFALKDYRLEFKTKDGRWWKHDKNYTKEETDAGYVLKLRFKLPKSDEVFDASITCRSISHKMKLTFKDGTSISANSPSRLCEKYFEGDVGPGWKKKRYEGGYWKGVKKASVTPPKKVKKFCRGIKSGYSYSFIAQHPTANIPLKVTDYFFVYKDYTYILTILMPTGAAKNERVTSEVDALIKSLDVKKKKKRRR